MQLNFITTCSGAYSMEYANKSYSMVKRHLRREFDAYCITDRPAELHHEITPISPLIDGVEGWWNKLFFFAEQMPDGFIFTLDVDVLVVGDLTPIINYATEHVAEMACYSDAIHWEGSKFSSSMMIFRSGALSHIYDRFKKEYPGIRNFKGGDQVWTFPQLSEILYLDEVFPGFKRSLKFQMAQQQQGKFLLPNSLPSELRLIDFHGRPKPHELTGWNVVREHWR
jgi:hypothetical protein